MRRYPLPPPKLSLAQAKEIRALLQVGQRPDPIASRFRVTYRTVYNIGTGNTWAHLGPPVLKRTVHRVRHHAAK